jgi:hypothetical protein
MVVAFLVSDTNLSVFWAVAIALLALFLQIFLTAGRRFFVAPSFLALIFGTGYPLSFANLVGRWTSLPSMGWGSVGRFAFTNDAMVQPFQVITAGVVGIAVGTRWSESLWSGLRTRTLTRRSSPPTLSSLIAWAFACAVVIGICAQLGIGRVGLDNATQLPLRLNGILVIARGYLLPTLGALLVQRALDAPRQEGLMLTLLLVTVVAVLASTSALSRGLGALYIVPVMYFAVLYQGALGRPLRRLIALAAGATVVLAFVGSVVSIQRTTMYSGEGWMSVADMAAGADEGSGISGGMVESFGELIGSRLGGVDGLLALVSGPGREPDPWLPGRLFMGEGDLIGQITMEAFGFLPDTSAGLAFGLGFSLWGLLAMGGAILLPFLGSALLTILVCSIEGVLTYYGEEGMGTMLACLFAFNAWGGPSFFNFIRVVPVLLVALLIARHATQSSRPNLILRAPGASNRMRTRTGIG